jgi:DNA-binding SARP family transcriptional activator
MLEISTLGGLTIRLNRERVTGLASRKAEALLVYLAVTRQSQPREFLADLLWDEVTQARAMGNLRVVLSSLRKNLEPFVNIRRDRVGIQTQAEIQVDVAELMADFSLHQTDTEFDQLKTAVGLYQGDFLLGFRLRRAVRFENWVIQEQEHCRTTFDKINQRLLDQLIANQAWHDAITWGENWIARSQHEHTPESAYRAIMSAYAGLEDLSGVSSVFQRCAQYLSLELGVDPSEQTQKLYEWLRMGGHPGGPAKDTAEAIPPPVADSAAQVVLDEWRSSGTEVIDPVSLALVHASKADLQLGPEEVALLVRSALHHNVEVTPWLEYLDTLDAILETLKRCLEKYTDPYIRSQIVDTLKEIKGEEANQMLYELAMGENDPDVRTTAALEVARRGEGDPLAATIAREVVASGNQSAIDAMVALMDFGIKIPEFETSAQITVLAAFFKLRWERYNETLRDQMLRSGTGASIASILHVSTAPFYADLTFSEGIQGMLNNLTAQSLLSALAYLLIGGCQGLASGFAIGLADALAVQRTAAKWRLFAGGLSGLVLSTILIILTWVGLLFGHAGPEVFIPVNIAYGILIGVGTSFVYPRLGELRGLREQLKRGLLVTLVLLGITTAQVYILYQELALSILPGRIMFVLLVVFGLAAAFSKPGKAYSPDG